MSTGVIIFVRGLPSPRRFIAQDKVASHVTCDLSRSGLPHLMVPISSRHANGNPRLATSTGGLSAQRQAAAAPARRSTLLGLALTALVGLATSARIRSGIVNLLADLAEKGRFA
jgi:hypothetical protein